MLIYRQIHINMISISVGSKRITDKSTDWKVPWIFMYILFGLLFRIQILGTTPGMKAGILFFRNHKKFFVRKFAKTKPQLSTEQNKFKVQIFNSIHDTCTSNHVFFPTSYLLTN